jgi:HEAT repeat protein
MQPIEALLLDLKSFDPSVRDRAALKLMDIGDERAICPLLEAITKPENVDYRGTLVHALSAFNCIEHLEVLVDICVTGDFEVSSGAFNAIEEIELTTAAIRRIDAQLGKFDIEHLPHENAMAFRALVQLTSGHRK